MDHTAERIMQQLEQEGDFTAEGIEAVRRAVGYSDTMRLRAEAQQSGSGSQV